MTSDNVEVSNGRDGGPTINGREFEIADRLKAGEELSASWTAADAVKSLVGWYNSPKDSGIDMPDFDAADFDGDANLRETAADQPAARARTTSIGDAEAGRHRR